MSTENKRNGADIILDHLIEKKMPYMIGVCGHADVALMDAAYDRREQFGTISVHDEQTAGFMADAFYRVTRQPLATFTSCGPGSISLQVAVANAMFDGSAMLAITGNVPTQQFNRLPFQEIGQLYQADLTTAMRPYVKRSFQATRPDMLPVMMRHAYSTMVTGKVGPVHLDIPLNVFNEETDAKADFAEGWLDNVRQDSAADGATLAQAVEMLLTAQRPVILAGNGALSAGVKEDLTRLARMLNIPVATTPQGKGAIDETDPLALGPTGRDGVYPANRATRGCDVILALGTRFGDRSSGSWRPGATHTIETQKLIHVDLDPSSFGRNYPPALAVLASVKAFVAQLIQALGARADDVARSIAARHGYSESWANWKRQWDRDIYAGANRRDVPIHPDRLIGELTRVVPQNAILACDIGQNHTWMVQQWKVRAEQQMLQSGGLAAMGMGVCGSLGAQLAAPDKPVVAVCGDGGMMMHSNAISTAVEYDLPVVWVVMNNCGYVSIRDLQRGFYGREYASRFKREKSGELLSADFAMMARAMGAQGMLVEQPDDLGSAIQTAIKSRQPTVIDVRVESELKRLTTSTLDFPPLRSSDPNYDPDPVR